MSGAPPRRIYAHVARGSISANGVTLEAGDAIRVAETGSLSLTEGRGAEVLVFDLPAAR